MLALIKTNNNMLAF